MHYLFADEAGCLTFERKPNVSRYFVLCTIHMPDCNIAADLLHLRRQLAWNGVQPDRDQFHATTDSEEVREAVYGLLGNLRFRIDATIFEKAKARPYTRVERHGFYQLAWYYHFKYVAPRIVKPGERLFIQAASVGQKKERQAFRQAIDRVAAQVLPEVEWRTSFWSADTDPCLQVADYCAWAIQRKWERGEDRRYRQIAANIRSEYDIWARSGEMYY